MVEVVTDIVQQLRVTATRAYPDRLQLRAADEIERLRDKIQELEIMRRLDAQIQAHA